MPALGEITNPQSSYRSRARQGPVHIVKVMRHCVVSRKQDRQKRCGWFSVKKEHLRKKKIDQAS